ncbi:Bgt-20978 [Blumeria graminis f. sp. tritici]|uniref:Bgt-20978 n=2 Tax=Blumeria graminis f. sp. tritici TaxID=62690 RepID=A0A9X9MFY7_BLUGR|nr:Bgt-20978 [Blumeria graminis f. sp. tritici]
MSFRYKQEYSPSYRQESSGNKSNKANTYHRPLHNDVKHIILIKPLFVHTSSRNYTNFSTLDIKTYHRVQILTKSSPVNCVVVILMITPSNTPVKRNCLILVGRGDLYCS